MRGVFRRVGRRAAEFADPFLGLRAGAVIDGDLVPGAGQVPRHRIAHHAEPQKRQFCHDLRPP